MDPFDKEFSHDEFFQSEEEVPVSETFLCKRILYYTIGTSAVKVRWKQYNKIAHQAPGQEICDPFITTM